MASVVNVAVAEAINSPVNVAVAEAMMSPVKRTGAVKDAVAMKVPLA